MTNIVRTVVNLLYPFCMLYGFYIVAHGHLTPGGGFQGGAVIATATALLLVANRYEEVAARIKPGVLKLFESGGLLGFILLAFGAFVFGRPFFQNWMLDLGWCADPVAYGPNAGNLNTAGVMPLMNLAVGLEVLGALTLILLAMLGGAHGADDPEAGGDAS